MPRLHCIVHGRVQGVGYRYFAVSRATALGLKGWVRNLRTGSVEIEAEGSRESLEAYRDALRRGPSYARVKNVEETWSEEEMGYSEFQVKPTM